MSDYGSGQADATAMLELLRADDDLTVFPPAGGGPSTVPPDTPAPYVSVHFHTEHIAGGRQDTKSTGTRTRGYAHCVGANDIAARAVADRVKAAWLDVRPTVPERSADMIRFEQAREPQTTEPVAQSTVTITVVYVLLTWPGPRAT